MVMVAEPNRVVTLDELDAVEDTAPNVARSLEGVLAAARHE